MADCIFVPYVEQTAWIRKILPDRSVAELPLAGRRYIDYAFEEALRFDVGRCEIHDWAPSDTLAASFAEMEIPEHPITYFAREENPPAGLDDFIGHADSPATRTNGDIAVIWGLPLIAHDKGEIRFGPVSAADRAQTPMGAYMRRDGRWMRVLPVGARIVNPRAWHMVNLAILRNPGFFTLPGYSAENGVHLGRNVVLEHGTEVRPPVLLDSNIWCARNVTLDGDVIVSSGSFIGEGAYLKRTVICENTYIGEGLEFIDKIVVGRRVIDPGSGAWTDISEKGVAREIDGFKKRLRKVWHFLLGKSHGRRG